MPQQQTESRMTERLGEQFDFAPEPARARDDLPDRPRTEPRGIDYFSGYADRLFGDPQGLSPEEQSRMHELSVREARLQPTERFVAGSPAPASAGTFGIDTRQALTGISNLILSLEDRRRFDELHGSPERQARLRSRAGERRERGEQRRTAATGVSDVDVADVPEHLQRTQDIAREQIGEPSLVDQVRGRLGERDIRRAGELEERAERFGGISEELTGLRGRAETAAKAQEARREFMTEQAGAELDLERTLRGDLPVMEFKNRLDQNLENVRQENRASLEELRQEGREELKRIESEMDNPQDNRDYAQVISNWVALPQREVQSLDRSIESLEETKSQFGDSLPQDDLDQIDEDIEEMKLRRRKAQRMWIRLLQATNEGKIAQDDELMNDIMDFYDREGENGGTGTEEGGETSTFRYDEIMGRDDIGAGNR